jgi:hypothetical protein
MQNVRDSARRCCGWRWRPMLGLTLIVAVRARAARRDSATNIAALLTLHTAAPTRGGLVGAIRRRTQRATAPLHAGLLQQGWIGPATVRRVRAAAATLRIRALLGTLSAPLNATIRADRHLTERGWTGGLSPEAGRAGRIVDALIARGTVRAGHDFAPPRWLGHLRVGGLRRAARDHERCSLRSPVRLSNRRSAIQCAGVAFLLDRPRLGRLARVLGGGWLMAADGSCGHGARRGTARKHE